MGLSYDTSNALTLKKWEQGIQVEVPRYQYFAKFMGTGKDVMISVKKDLTRSPGDQITMGLRMKMRSAGVEGDDVIEGTDQEKSITTYSQVIKIDQQRFGNRQKGKMSEQRVAFDIRMEAKNALKEQFAAEYDQEIFMYLSGARGIEPDGDNDGTWNKPLDFTGRAGNSFAAPDSDHILYGGNATGKADLQSDDLMNAALLERVNTTLKMANPILRGFNYKGQTKHIVLMSPLQAHSLRTTSTAGDWKDIHKYTDNAKDSKLYQDSLGDYAGLILHEHRNVIRFDDYGVGTNLPAARALCLGAQAGCFAYGGNDMKTSSYNWNEETDDRGNQTVITVGSIYGVVKSRYNSADYGVIAMDTYASSTLA